MKLLISYTLEIKPPEYWLLRDIYGDEKWGRQELDEWIGQQARSEGVWRIFELIAKAQRIRRIRAITDSSNE